MAEDQKKAQERAVYLATQQIIEHLISFRMKIDKRL